jgi:hypothetical protein
LNYSKEKYILYKLLFSLLITSFCERDVLDCGR